ncbi:hypothetical protein [Actibacterium sp. D379-3]
MQFEFNRETKARIHLAMLESLLPDIRPTGGMPDDDTSHAFAETVAYAEYPGEVFELARAVDAFTAKELYRADVQYVTVDASDLRAALDVETVNLALRLCGIRARSAHGRQVRWTDAPDREPTMPVTLPATLLEDWNAD